MRDQAPGECEESNRDRSDRYNEARYFPLTKQAMPRLGQMSFQSNDSKDVFHVCDVIEPGIETPDEIIMRIDDFPHDGYEAWITGKVPAFKTVDIEGDTTVINAWFRGEYFENKFFITVYVEYECAEEWIGIEPEREERCEPKDIIL